jgi:hypothetical protein
VSKRKAYAPFTQPSFSDEEIAEMLRGLCFGDPVTLPGVRVRAALEEIRGLRVELQQVRQAALDSLDVMGESNRRYRDALHKVKDQDATIHAARATAAAALEEGGEDA